ncbi:DgyrCDS4811 [Dimorphilus gyrociliatus]|nr:DgyrCDS4811 [Dimorphilus gyrociliatus]
MSAFSQRENALATKVVGFYPENKDEPTHPSDIMLYNPLNGSLQAIMDGTVITEYRTGLVSAIASKHLANPTSKILAILGSGVQCTGHFNALSLLYNFDDVRIWNINIQSAEIAAKKLGKPCRVCTTAEEAVKDADIICTVTSTSTPVLNKDWVKPGCHINSVGAVKPKWQELESDLMRSSVVYVDSKEAACQETGDIIISKCEIYAEIGEVINGQKEARWHETTVFKSVGKLSHKKYIFIKYLNKLIYLYSQL